MWQMPELTDAEFSQFQKLLYDLTGISLNETKMPLVSSRLLPRMRQFECRSFSEYLRIVRSDAAESQHMTDLLTTNETRFFREDTHLEFLKEALAREPGRPYTLWSAACSSGEEPYSMAMVCAEALGAEGDYRILGSDISQRVLDRASRAMYAMDRASAIPLDLLKKYCLRGVRTNEGFFSIVPELRRRVEFKQVNLLEIPPNLGIFDFVFLRNVMIYFDQPTRARIISSIVPLLSSKGYLIIGSAESLLGVSDTLESVQPHVYRRRK